MRVLSAIVVAMTLGLLPAAAQTPAPDTAWVTATELPGTDLSGLSAAQKTVALKSMRKEDCLCGCQMKVAQCRVVDPPCTDSKALAAMTVAAAKEGKTAAEIHDVLIHSKLAKMRADQNRILGDPQVIPVAGDPVRGPANAKITIVEFSDFECPYCSKAVLTIAALLKEYPTDMKLIYKQFPLEMHPNARIAAVASLAAGEQGKFWEMHDKLFANSRQLSRERILALAKGLGLDMMRFQRDLDSGRFDKRIETDIRDGEEAGVQGTPTIFLDGKRYNGPVDEAALKPLLNEELKQGNAVAAR